MIIARLVIRAGILFVVNRVLVPSIYLAPNHLSTTMNWMTFDIGIATRVNTRLLLLL